MTTSPPERWTVVALLTWTAEYLGEKGFENGRLEAERLLAHVLGFQRIDLYLQFDRPLDSSELSRFKTLLKKRLENFPLQYLLGETEFMSLAFSVSPAVLIPRPETEVLVEKALSICDHELADLPDLRVLDIGAGSGAIAVSIAHAQPRAHVVAVDLSAEALQVARKNGERHAVQERIEFVQHDAHAPWPTEWLGSFDLVLSNPPYIREQEFPGLAKEIRLHEPQSALLAQQDGLEFYMLFAQLLPKLLRPQGFALLEIGADMAQSTCRLFAENGFSGIDVLQDLAGRDRVLQLRATAR